MQDLKWALSHSESMPTRTKCGGGHARDQHERRTTTRAIWPAHSDKRVTWAISRWRPRHKESYPARTKWQEDCANDIKMNTGPQRDSKSWCPEQRWTSQFQYDLVRHLLQVSWPSKNEAQASEVFSPSERIGAKKHHPSSPHCACQAKKTGSLQVLSFWPTLASILATCMKYCACHADEKVSEVLCLPHKTKFWPSKSAESLTPAAKNVHSSKNGGGTQVWTGHVFVRGWSPSKNEDRWTFVP